MAVEKHLKNMLAACLARLHFLEPKETADRLARYQFKPGDIRFRITKGSGRPWCDVQRWPWESKQPPPASVEAAPMPDPDVFPVRVVFNMRDHDEHLEMVQLASEVGLDFDAWAFATLRAAAKEAKNRR